MGIGARAYGNRPHRDRESWTRMMLADYFEADQMDASTYATAAADSGVCPDCLGIIAAGVAPVHCRRILPEPCTRCGNVPETYATAPRVGGKITGTPALYYCDCRAD